MTQAGVKAGDRFTPELFERLLAEEYEKLPQAGNRDVHDDSKTTTLPIAREIVETYVMDDVKLPWYIDLLNINLDNHDLTEAQAADPTARRRRFARTGRGSRRTWISKELQPRSSRRARRLASVRTG